MSVTLPRVIRSSISSLKKCTLENRVAAVGQALYCVRHFWKGQQKQPGSLAKARAKGRRGADKSVLPECPTQWPGLWSRLFFRPSGRMAAACFPFKNNVESITANYLTTLIHRINSREIRGNIFAHR